jgi:hypothetical protein
MSDLHRAFNDLLSGFNACLSLLNLQELSRNVRLVRNIGKRESQDFNSDKMAALLE